MKTFFVLLLLSASAHAVDVRVQTWHDGFTRLSETTCLGEPLKIDEPCVLREEYQVPTPNGKGVGSVHWITVVKDSGTDDYGLADADGKTIIKPTQGTGMVLNTRSMVVCTSLGCSIVSADAKKKPLGDVVYLEVPKAPPLLFVKSKDEKGREGLAALIADGSLGPVLVGADIKEAFMNGQLAVMKVHAAPGVAASVMIDAGGQIVWAGPELRVYGIPNQQQMSGANDEGNIELRVTLQLVGPAGLRALDSDPNMYIPLNGLTPMKMPKDVVGLIPAYAKEHPILSSYKGVRPEDMFCWIVVKKDGKKQRYYIAEGKADVPIERIFDDLAKLEEIDEITYFYKDGWGQDSKFPAPPTVHRVKTKDWKTMLPGKEAVGVTANASFDKWLKLKGAMLNAEIAAQLAREEKAAADRKRGKELRAAEEAAARAQDVERWKKQAGSFGSKCMNESFNNRQCYAVEDAAFGLGDPGLTEFLSHQVTFNGPTEKRVARACEVSASACSEAQRIAGLLHANEEAMREQRYQLENGWKTYTQQKIHEMQQGQTYTVPYYEYGQLKYKTMNSDEYHRVYGN